MAGIQAAEKHRSGWSGLTCSDAAGFSAWVRARPLRWVPLMVSAWLVVYVSWTWLHWIGDPTVVSDVAPIPVAAAATVFAWLAARTVSIGDRSRRAWRLVALACAAWTAGEAVWCYLEVVRHSSPFPSLADGCYLAFYPLMFAGLAVMPVGYTRRDDRFTLGLDAAAVTIATLMAVWYLVIAPTAGSHHDSLLAELLSLAYPVGDLILVLGAARLLLRRPGKHLRVPLWCLIVGVLAFALADIVYARLSLANTYQPGTLPDALWMIGLCALALAGWTQWTGHNRSDIPPEEIDAEPQISKLPYIAVAGGLGLLLYEAALDARAPMIALVVGALALTGVVVWRQLAVMRENDRLVAELHRIANTDPLTGLLSRRRLLELGQRALRRGAHDATPIAVFMIDIDHFKTINDTAGHQGGDDVLRNVARRCETVLRPGDLFGRYGGDELVAIITGTTTDAADQLATRLGAVTATEPVFTAEGSIAITISVGVTVTSTPATLEELLLDADIALYQAKTAGRNQHVTHTSPDTTTNEHSPRAIVESTHH